ncbi:hypothetical protein [Yoonia sp. R2-816]|uniref:hypothetical protein n=1 Tax=Yoonia sp. R2-816 TaxID=3342638 RepID=UPI00372A7635
MKKIMMTGSILALSACGTSGGSDGPTFDISDDVTAFAAEADRFRVLSPTGVADLPPTAGFVTYDGQISARTTRGLNDADVIADIQFQIDFVSTEVDGSMTNIAVLTRTGESISTTGTLNVVSGAEADGTISARMEGTIESIRLRDNQPGGMTFGRVDFTGNIVNDDSTADGLFGSVEADFEGDLPIPFAGDFYASQQPVAP